MRRIIVLVLSVSLLLANLATAVAEPAPGTGTRLFQLPSERTAGSARALASPDRPKLTRLASPPSGDMRAQGVLALDIPYATYFSDYGSYFVEGYVGNPNSSNMEGIMCRVTFYDSSDELVDEYFGFPFCQILRAGYQAPFSVTVDPPVTAVSYDVEALGIETSKSPYHATLTSFGSFIDTGWLYYNGTFRNDTGTALRFRYAAGEERTGGSGFADSTFLNCLLDYFEEGERKLQPGQSFDFVAEQRDPSYFSLTPVYPGMYAEGRPLATVGRISGANRYATACQVSAKTFPSADTVVLATGTGYADALSAAGLAGVFEGPLLLTQRDVVPTEVLAELVRLGASKVVIVGGVSAVSDIAKAKLADLGYSVERIAGSDRYDTSARIAKRIKDEVGAVSTVYVARGDSFPDALAAGPMAAREAMPILLTRPTALPSATASALTYVDPSDAVVLGGTGAVSNGVAGSLGLPYERVAGSDRYETAVTVAEHGIANGWATHLQVAVANGTNFPDALAAGPAFGYRAGCLVLTAQSALPAVTDSWFDYYDSYVDGTSIVGGTSAVSEGVKTRLTNIMQQ